MQEKTRRLRNKKKKIRQSWTIQKWGQNQMKKNLNFWEEGFLPKYTTVSTDFHRYPSKISDFFPELYLPDWLTSKKFHHCQITWSPSFDTRWFLLLNRCLWHHCRRNRRNLLKLFAHCLETQIHLWDKKIQKIQHRNLLKKGSLSENVLKEDERVLFQPFHA